MTYSDWVKEFHPVVIAHTILIRELIYRFPDRTGLWEKANRLTLNWTRRYTREQLLEELSKIVRLWCKLHGTTVKKFTEETKKRYWIRADGWIERTEGWTPFEFSEPLGGF